MRLVCGVRSLCLCRVLIKREVFFADAVSFLEILEQSAPGSKVLALAHLWVGSPTWNVDRHLCEWSLHCWDCRSHWEKLLLS